MNKKRFFAVVALVLVCVIALAACGGGETPHTHEWGEWTSVTPATCEGTGTEKRVCKLDPTHVETRPVDALGHKWSTEWVKDEKGHTHVCENGCGKTKDDAAHSYHNGACTECGYVHSEHAYEGGACEVCGKRLYTMSGDGEKIYFGEYPQSEVKESAETSALTAKAGELPTEEDAGGWTSYGYYYAGEVVDYMWYIDVELDGSKYRGVYFTQERNYKTGSAYLSYQQDNGYSTETVYWFRFEPVEWRVLESSNGTALLMANVILDAGHYYHNTETRTQNDETVYSNNYKESDVRKWLLETFYETAFDADEKKIIEKSTVDNSGVPEDNPYACEDTQDFVFLPGYREVLSEAYGFVENTVADASRQLTATDYAKAQGIQPGKNSECFNWWLRTPEQAEGKTVFRVSYDGQVEGGNWWFGGGEIVDMTRNGIVPALRLSL